MLMKGSPSQSRVAFPDLPKRRLLRRPAPDLGASTTAAQAPIRLNVGCGPTPTSGWQNLDNSWSVRLAGHRPRQIVLKSLKLLSPSQMTLVGAAEDHGIKWADATQRLPYRDNSVAAIYTSHMLEHLEPQDALAALREFHRVLEPGGTLRVSVPDLGRLIDAYGRDGDADAFLAATGLIQPGPKTLKAKLQCLVVGQRHHQWMYDARSLIQRLTDIGFVEIGEAAGGCTRITEPDQLDLAERAAESVIVEATKTRDQEGPR